jgi:hypothetical protein
MIPALVPTIEPVVQRPPEHVESVHSFAEHSPDIIPDKFRQGNETQRPVSEKESVSPPEPENKNEIAHAPVVTPSDEERDFPL